MSKTIDQRVVEMRFDNANFEKNVSTSMSTLDKLKKSLKFEDSAKGFENISKAAGRVDMGGLSNGVESVRLKFSALEVMAVTALQNITNSALNAGKKIAYALTIEPIKAGLQEYETQINATQTILANTQKEGANINDVNRALNELNKYADLTIYNFTEMTRNIGTFTAAGVDLNTSVNAIKGIANLAAVSGSSSQQASTAMYQLSQALASGTVKLQDWNSVVNANMGGQVFQDALKMTARIHGIAIDEMIADEGSFRETLSKGWLTKDILTETLQHFTEFTDTYNEESLKRQGYNDKEIAEIKQMGITATDAATKIKTFSQLWDVLKESAQSGWTTSWQTIIGDFEEAKETLTVFGDTLTKMIGDSADARNAVLKEGFMSGWKQLLNEGIEDTEGFQNAIIEAGKNSGVAVDDLIKKYGSFEKSLKGGWVTSDMLKTALDSMADSVAGLSKEELEAKGYTDDQRQALLNLVEAVKDGSLNLDEFAEKMGRASGRENMVDAITMAFEKLMPIINQVGDAFQEVFNPNNDLGQRIYNMTARVREFVDGLEVSEKGLHNFKMSIEGVLSIFHIAGKGVSAFAQIIGHLLGKLLPVGDGILDVTGSIGEFLVSLDKAIDSGGYLEKFVELVNGAIDKLASGFKVAKDYVLDFIGSWTGIDFTKFESLRDIFALIGEKLSEFGEKIRDTFPWVNSLKDTVTAAFQKIRGSADEDLGATNHTLERLSEIGSKLKDAFAKIAEKVKTFFAPVATAIKHAFGELTILDLFDSAVFVGIYKLIKQFLDLFTGFDGLGKSVTKLLDSARDAIKAWQVDIQAEVLLKIAKAVAILAASLWVISNVDETRVLGSLGVVTALLVEVGAVLGIASKMVSKTNSLEGLADGLQLDMVAKALLVISGSVLLLSLALKKCEGLNWKDTLPSMTAMFVLLGEMVTAMGIFMKLVRKNPIEAIIGTSIDDITSNVKNVRSMAENMVIMAGAMYLLAAAVAKLGKMPIEQLKQGGVAVSILMIVTGGITAGLKAIKASNMMGIASSLLALAFGLNLLILPIKLLSKMNLGELKQGLIAVGIAMGEMAVALSILAAVNGLFSKTGQSGMSGVARSLLSLSIAMTILVIPLKLLGTMDLASLAKGLIAMSVALWQMVSALTALTAINGMFGSITKVGTAMLALSAGLLILAAALKFLGSMSIGELVSSISGLAIALVLLSMTASKMGKSVEALDKLANVFMKLGLGALGLSALIALLGLASPIVEAACDTLMRAAPKIAKAVLVLIDEILIQLDAYVPLIIEHLASIIKKIGEALSKYFGEITTSDWISAAIFAGIVAASGFLVKWFSSLAKDVPKALIGAAGVAAILVIVGGIIAAMTLLDLNSVMGIAASLSAVLLSLSVMIGVLGMMPLTAGLAAGLVLAEFIAVMATIMAALGGLNQIPGFSWLMDEGIKVLGQIGEGIGTFVGSIVGAAIERITAGIAESGTYLSKFMTNLGPFIEGAKSIKSDVLTGIANLAGAILLLGAAAFVEGVLSLLSLGTGSLASLGTQLALFGPSFAAFAYSISGINAEAVSASAAAIAAISEVIATMSRRGILDRALDLFTGSNSLVEFAEGLEPFGAALIAYGKAVRGIEAYTSDIDSSAEVAEDLVSIAKTIPNSGGLAGLIAGNNDLKDFAKGMKPFGEALINYGKAVLGIGDYKSDIKKSVNVAEELIKIAEIVPNSGGVLGFIAGNNDLQKFAKNLKPFGEALVDYGTAVNGISEKSSDISASVTAAKDIVSLAAEAKGAANAKDLKKIGEGLVGFATQIKNFMAECEGLNAGQLESLKTALQSIVDIASSFSTIDMSALTDFVQSMEKIGSTSVDEFLSSFSESKTAAATAVNALIANLKSSMGTSESQLKRKFEEVAKKGLEGLTSKKSEFNTAGADLMKSLSSGVSSQTATVKNQFSIMLSNCVAAVRSYYGQFRSAGSYLAAGVANGISANSASASLAAKKMAGNAAKSSAKRLDEHSPSRVGYKIGDYFGIGFTNGITDNIRNAGISSDALAESATKGLSNAVSKIATLIDSGIDTNPTIRPVLDLTEIQNGSAAMAELMSTLSGRPVEGTVSIAAKTASSMNRPAFAPEQQTETPNGQRTSENTTNNFYITGTDPRAIADEVDRKLQRRVERRKAAWA